jgi:hypothetical protein
VIIKKDIQKGKRSRPQSKKSSIYKDDEAEEESQVSVYQQHLRVKNVLQEHKGQVMQ